MKQHNNRHCHTEVDSNDHISYMFCIHQEEISRLHPPTSQFVHREECTQCFDSQDSESGVDVCLTCFNGGCTDPERNHALIHVQKNGHPFTLNIKRRPKPFLLPEPPTKLSKIAILDEREDDKYERFTSIKCWRCDSSSGKEVEVSNESLVNAVINSTSLAHPLVSEAWEEEIQVCQHTINLIQTLSGSIPPSGLAQCLSCDLRENLWLCLACGSLGCGRSQYGGLGGNGHGLAHFHSTGHAVSVKLGTITPEGNADIYCYICNDARLDNKLVDHLAAFGIDLLSQVKTEKSMTELQIEHNLKYDFSLMRGDGEALEPLFGPKLTGLSNLGNSCYMASVLQALFALPSFQLRYSVLAASHASVCTVPYPADCVECQMHKVADGLLSGRYSHPANYSSPSTNMLQHQSPEPVFQNGIKPAGFKRLIGKDHREFSSMRQQDSEEFFRYLLLVLRRDMHKHRDRLEQDPTSVFTFSMEQRLQCTECKRVRYSTEEMDVFSIVVPPRAKEVDTDGKALYEDVQLCECVSAVLETETLEYGCHSCGKSVYALKQSKFSTFPEIFVVHAKKFQVVNWISAKLHIPLILPADDTVEFDAKHLSTGLQHSEIEFPNDTPKSFSQFNEAAMSQLQSMGISEIRCKKALQATGNADSNAAVDWLFQHMDDPDIDEPLADQLVPEPSPENLQMLVDMGFTIAQAKKSLGETNGNVERAIDWLFNHSWNMDDQLMPSDSDLNLKRVPGSNIVPTRYILKAFISHKGPSLHSGHYVAHILTQDGNGWVLYNDEKVVKADEESVRELKKSAYLYFFEKVRN